MNNRYKFKCKHSGCSATFVAESYLKKHEAKKHFECKICGKMLTSLSRHEAHRKRGHNGCVDYKQLTAGTLTVY